MTFDVSTVSGFRLSPQQEHLWRQALAFEPVTARLVLAERLDPRRLRTAVNTLLTTHEILRTKLRDADDGSGPVQAVNDHVAIRDLAPRAVDADHPFVASLTEDGNGCVLTLSAVAASADPWSLPVLLEQISLAYLAPDGAIDPSGAMQYADLAEGYRELLEDHVAREYWNKRAPYALGAQVNRCGDADAHALREAVLRIPAGWDDARAFARWVVFQSRWTRRGRFNTRYMAPGTRLVDGSELVGPIARPLVLPFQVDWAADMKKVESEIIASLADDLAFADHHDCLSSVHAEDSGFIFQPGVRLPRTFAGIPVVSSDWHVPTAPATFGLTMTGSGEARVIARALDERRFAEAVHDLRMLFSADLDLRGHTIARLPWHTAHMDGVRPSGATDILAEIDTWARRDPQRVALRDDHGFLSYSALYEEARAACAALRDAGAAPGSVIALQLPRGRDWPLWWLATWMLDATAAPLACGMPSHQVAEWCEALGASHLVSIRTDTEGSMALRRIASSDRVTAHGIGHQTPSGLHPAYVLSTSGSTGLPKATAIGHAALSAYLAWARERYAGDGGNGTLLASEITFDFTQTCLWLPLIAGETLHFAPSGARVEDLPALLRELPDLAFVKLTPTHLQVLREAESAGGPPTPWPPHVIVGGEALAGAMVPPSLRRAGAIVHNEYGPTEATVGCCVYSVPADSLPEGPVPIGGAVAGTELLVLDASMDEVVGDASGSLFVAGEQLAWGYKNDPRRTAASFLPHPRPRCAGERCYRTGDMVGRAVGSALVFLGRDDDVVKRHGVRIELNAVTARLLAHPDVTGCHTFTRVTGPGQLAIVCAVTGKGLDAQALRSWLAARMPAFELPNRIVIVAALPLTPQGKIDRDALEREIESKVELAESPLGGTEATLAEIWRRVLGTSTIGPASHFFVEGGDSIRAISVAVAARKQGLAMAAEDIFRFPVLRDLAAAIPQRAQDVSTPPPHGEATILPEGVVERLPVSYLQMGMIFQNQSYAMDGRYHDIFSYRLRLERIDEDCLREAARRLVRKHAALRTTFDLAGTDAVQTVWAEAPDMLEIACLQGQPAELQQAAVEAWIATERARGFDTTKLPLLRFMVHRLDACTIQFTTSFHHAIMDGWSDQQIHAELFEDYRRLLRGEAGPAEPMDSRYRDFVAAERQAIESPIAMNYWRDYLAEATNVPLGDDPEQHEQTLAASPLEHRIELSSLQAQALMEASRKTGEPVSVLLLSAHLTALRIMTGQSDVVSSQVVNCRLDGEAMERSVGLFINTVPVRARVNGGTWEELVARVGRSQRESFIHRRLPFVQIGRILGKDWLPSSIFYFTHFHNGIARTSELVQLDKQAHEVTSFPLTASFNLDPLSGRLSYTLVFARLHFSPTRADQVVACYEAALASLASGVHGRLPTGADVPGLPLSAVSGPVRTGEGTWLDMLAAQVRERPKALAATDVTGSLTFAGLDRQASNIASGLVARGIRPGHAVVLFLPRGIRLVAGIVGVARAGAVVVMIDANEPTARRDHIMRSARLVISDRTVPPGLPADTVMVALEDLEAEGAHRTVSRVAVSTAWPAYRMFTSGSTGLPKCVEVSHANYAAVLKHFFATLQPSPGDRIMQTSAISFDISLLEYGLALSSGAVLSILDPEAVVTPAAYEPPAGFVGRTLVQATPSLWSVLRLRGLGAFPRLTALAGGEALPADLRDWIAGRAEQTWNVYGPTETTIWSTVARVDGAPLTIGQPIAGTRAYLLDHALDLVPQGSIGMLYIGGDGISMGYVGDGRATAAAFVPDPFDERPGSRMYATGDLARLDNAGRLVFCGRADTQVKISGHRLEIAEVETWLRAHPAIAEAVVLAPDHPDDGLSAYLLPIAGMSLPSRTNLQSWLSPHLPPYAMPRRYGVLEAMPRTANGKLDRRAVASFATMDEDDTIFVPPSGHLESVLQKLWSKVLKIEDLSVTASFLDLGGYSLTAIRIVAQLRDLFGVDVPATRLFTVATVRELAEHLRTAFPEADVERKAAILASVLG